MKEKKSLKLVCAIWHLERFTEGVTAPRAFEKHSRSARDRQRNSSAIYCFIAHHAKPSFLSECIIFTRVLLAFK